MRLAALLFTGTLDARPHQEVLHSALAFALAAEAAGWDEVWTTEHHFSESVVNPDALTLAAYLLGRTRRVRIGTGVTVLPLHEPLRVAEQALLLSALEPNRFRLGLGRGGLTAELEGLGRGRAAHAAFGDDLAVLQALLKTRRQGAAPLTPDHGTPLPLVVAATTPATARSAARLGLPLLLAFPMTDAQKAQLLATYATTARAHGHDPARVEHWCSVVVHLGASKAAARRELARFKAWNLQAAREVRFLEPPAFSPTPEAWDAILEHQAFGTPAEVAGRLRAMAVATGVDRFAVLFDGALEDAAAHRNLTGMAEVRDLLEEHARGKPSLKL